MDLSKSEEEYSKEARKFLDELTEFHQKIGSNLRRIPTLGGRELDVYHLYKKVESMGGYDRVSQNRQWGEVARSFNLPSSVTSASYAVRHHYIKLLEKYEACQKDPSYLFYLQSNASNHSLAPQPTPSPLPTPPSRPTLPHPSPITAATPTSYRVGAGLVKREGHGRLARSLLSGFPNEVDFAFNAVTMLSYKSPASFSPSELPRLLDLLLAHVAVFPETELYDEMGLESLYQECWYKDSSTDFIEFWAVVVPEWVYANVYSKFLNISSHIYSGLFGSRQCTSEQSMESYRVNQVACILDNLSQHPPFLPVLSEHHCVLKFLLLATQCDLPEINSTALDTLVALSPSLTLPPSPLPSSLPLPLAHGSPLELLLDCTFNSVLSNDRMIVLKGLHVLSQLTWSPPNTDVIERVQKGVWQKLFQLLVLPDIQLVLLSLDTLYQFTARGSVAIAAAIFHQVQRCCEVLLSLLTLDIKNFGPDIMDNIKLIRVAPPPISETTPTQPTPSKPTARTTPVRVGMDSKLTSSLKPSPGSKPVPTQTIKIGNCIIPVVSGATSPLLRGHKTTPKTIPTSGSTPKPLRGPTVLTIQQLQNLLGKKLPIVSHQGAGGKGAGAGGTAAVTITGGSNITITRKPAAGKVAESADGKGTNNSLKSYLMKPTTPPTSSTTTPRTSSTTLPPTPLTATPLTSLTTPPTAFTATNLPKSTLTSLSGRTTPTTTSQAIILTTPIPTQISTPILSSTTPTSTQTLSSASTSSLADTRSSLASSTPSPPRTQTPPPRTHTPPPRTHTPPPRTQTLPPRTHTPPPQTPPPRTQTPPPRTSISPSLASSPSPAPSGNSSLSNKAEEFASQWLESNYEGSRGSYIAQLEVYSLYLLASAKAGHINPLSSTEFSSLLRRVFPNALSTRVSVGTQSVYMIAGLSKKRTIDEPQILTVSQASSEFLSSSSAQVATAVKTQSVSSSTSLTGLTNVRPDYSTQSPLAISSKAKADRKVGVAVNGLEPEDECPAKRMKLTPNKETKMELGDETKAMVTANGTTVVNLNAKVEKLLKRNHHLLQRSSVDRSPSPSIHSSRAPSPSPSTESTLHFSPTSSRTISPLPPDTPLSSATPPNSQDADSAIIPFSASDLQSTGSSDNMIDIIGVKSDSKSTGLAPTSDNVKPCLWSSCNSLHLGWSALLRHVMVQHLSSLTAPTACLWLKCPSKANRSKTSLLAHLQACHCGGSLSPSSILLPNSQKALARLKSVQPLQDEEESPLTKAVRLTAALVLRNLMELLPEARRHMKRHEQELCQVALSDCEASTAAAQCLHSLQTTR